MIYVVTGQPRHGKSQYVMKMLLGFIEENKKREEKGLQARDIYCDIAGINAPSTPTQLPSVQNQWSVFGDSPLWFGEHDDPTIPEGYVCPKPASVFIYDECHKVDWIKDTTGNLSKNPTTISMNEHGHEDFIFILITQFPQYIHTHLRGLVEYHYHVKRFNGLNQATVYKWNEFKTSPRTKTAIDDIFEKERFRFNKKYYNCYKSASAHDSMKFKLPKEWAMALLVVAVLGSFMVWRYFNSPIKTMVDNRSADIVAANKGAQADTVDNPMKSDAMSDEATPMTDEEKIAALEDELQALKDKYLPAHIVELTKSEDILPTAVVAYGSECRAMNKYGEYLQVGDTLCRKMLSDPAMMPKSRTARSEPSNSGHGSGDIISDATVEVKQVEPI